MSKEREGKTTDLTSDDGDRRKLLPESRQSRAAAAAVITEESTGCLNPIDEAYQALHGGHYRSGGGGSWASERWNDDARCECEGEEEIVEEDE